MIARHLGSRQVSRVTYGAIIGLALVVALQAHPPPPGAVIATLLGTAIAVGLAKWTGLGLLALYGFAGARLTGSGLPAALVKAGGVALIGGMLILLKSLVH